MHGHEVTSLWNVGSRCLAIVAAIGGFLFVSGDGRSAPMTFRKPSTEIDVEAIKTPAGSRIDDYLARAENFGFSGTVLIAIGDGPVLHKGYGYADLAARQHNTTDTVFDIGSITKTLTGGAILLLQSEGKLSVNDSIGRYFPNVPADKQQITLHHLLTHTSGIIDPPLGDYEPIGRDAFVKLVLERPLGAKTGTYNYSNAGFSMLAAVIERVAGSPYEEFMHTRLFLPAGMNNTGYTLPHWNPARVAHTYTLPVDHGTPLERLRSAHGPGWVLMGNGGVLGTTGDLYRWARALRIGTVIPKDKAALAFEPHFWRNPRSAIGYDWQIEIDKSGQRSYGHGSDAPPEGLNGWLGLYPSRDAAIILLANNRLNGASTRRFIVPNILQLIDGNTIPLPPRVHPISRSRFKKLEGVFTKGPSQISIRASNGHLDFGANGQEAVDLLNARQGAAAVAEARRLNGRASQFLMALQAGDAASLAPFIGEKSEVSDFIAKWSEAIAANGDFRSGTVLGTYRLDRANAFLTTLRLNFASREVIVRFGWHDGKVITESDDGSLPAFAGPLVYSPVPYAAWRPYWYAKGDEMFTFDLLTGNTLAATLRNNGSHVAELLFQTGARQSRWVKRP